jgi:dihydrofolate reductase
MEIIVIACISKNNVIGKDGNIPWRLGEDMKHFQTATMGYTCIMGRVTYESLPDNSKPLPGRENIILTSDRSYNVKGAKIFHDWDDAMKYLEGRKKIFICGGARLYIHGLKLADTLMLTRIHKDMNGDVFFPVFDENEWKLVEKEDGEGIDKNSGELLRFSFITYKRKTPDNI